MTEEKATSLSNPQDPDIIPTEKPGQTYYHCYIFGSLDDLGQVPGCHGGHELPISSQPCPWKRQIEINLSKTISLVYSTANPATRSRSSGREVAVQQEGWYNSNIFTWAFLVPTWTNKVLHPAIWGTMSLNASQVSRMTTVTLPWGVGWCQTQSPAVHISGEWGTSCLSLAKGPSSSDHGSKR